MNPDQRAHGGFGTWSNPDIFKLVPVLPSFRLSMDCEQAVSYPVLKHVMLSLFALHASVSPVSGIPMMVPFRVRMLSPNVFSRSNVSPLSHAILPFRGKHVIVMIDHSVDARGHAGIFIRTVPDRCLVLKGIDTMPIDRPGM
jgi:hypothetical protein